MKSSHDVRAAIFCGAPMSFSRKLCSTIRRKGLGDAVAIVRSLRDAFRGPRRATMLAAATLMAACFQVTPASAAECFWNGTKPFCSGSCPSGYVVTKREACTTGHKVYCCEQTGSVTSDGPGQPYLPAQAAPCPSGLVWRERFDGDTVCVTPGERDNNRRSRGLPVSVSACPSGLVWREQFDGDTFCVSPVERDANRRRRGLPVGQ